MNFAHLHVHTEYSLLDGSNKIKEYVSRVKELGMNSAAITDHGVMYGCIDFYKAAKEAGINPILGCEVYVAPGSRLDKNVADNEKRYYHLVLLAENNQGYANLMKIVSAGFLEGFYYKPRVDLEILERYHEGIIALSACLAGEVARNLAMNFYEEAKAAALRYANIFGPEHFYLELQDHGIEMQKQVNAQMLRLAEDTGLPLVATNDIHYTYAEDADAHDILLCLQTGKKLSDENRMRYPGGNYYVKSPEQMYALFPYAKEAVENTQKIADRCHVEIKFHELKLPKFEVPEGYTSWTYLQELCNKGLAEKYDNLSDEIRERLAYELDTIHNMGFVDYFLIVWDYVRFAKSEGIIVGPGRGSAAGSLVSYTLGITELDPLKYNLLFERFLNPERVSMPDIDIDFCFERRQEVIDYVVKKYGPDRVVQIVTFGTLAAKGVIRDVGRVLDLPYSKCDQIAKMIPNELNITIDKALAKNHELQVQYQEDPEVKKLIDMGKRLEGLPRHTSMHAAGVVISSRPADDFVPLSRAADGTITTEYTMTTLEELGLLKMDFLGLRTLTVLQNAQRMAEHSSGKSLDLEKIDYNDPKVMQMIGQGRCEGVFQLESAGMKSFMTELKPTALEDIIAGVALYRPGPMDFIPKYIEGKKHPERVRYDAPQLEEILKPTYGCIVYQEQVMQIVRELAGYSYGRSDVLRRAMSKKKSGVMEQERKSFVYGNEADGLPGCVNNGIDERTANHIYDEMLDFAKYAFNKSHAAAYAVVSYQTAWLKYYYPVEFMAALMTSVIDNPGKVSEYILHCRQMGIEILPPDINQSIGGFSVENGKIRFGLSAIKGIGKPVMKAIEEERNAHGPFKHLRDFCERLSGKEVNKRTLENFIKAGAFDCLGGTRKQFLQTYMMLLDEIAEERKKSMSGQVNLFDLMPEEMQKQYEYQLPDIGEFSDELKLTYEKEVIGIYISGHPLRQFAEKWKKHVTKTAGDFRYEEEAGTSKVHDGDRVMIGGVMSDISIRYTKRNEKMAFFMLEDLVGTVEVIVFPKTYKFASEHMSEDAKVFLSGRVQAEDERDSKLVLERIIPFSDVTSQLWLQYQNKEAYQKDQDWLSGLTEDIVKAKDELVIYLKEEKGMKVLTKELLIDETVLEACKKHLGEENVRVTEKMIEKRSGMR